MRFQVPNKSVPRCSGVNGKSKVHDSQRVSERLRGSQGIAGYLKGSHGRSRGVSGGLREDPGGLGQSKGSQVVSTPFKCL